jgi:hypothetical protein
VDPNIGLTQDKLSTSAVVALHFLIKGQHPCHATLSLGDLPLATVRQELLGKLCGNNGQDVTEDNLEQFVHALSQNYQGEA